MTTKDNIVSFVGELAKQFNLESQEITTGESIHIDFKRWGQLNKSQKDRLAERLKKQGFEVSSVVEGYAVFVRREGAKN